VQNKERFNVVLTLELPTLATAPLFLNAKKAIKSIVYKHINQETQSSKPKNF
jgi:hypothetical protein